VPAAIATLVATLGSKPQIITLALDCLRAQRVEPREVVILHTRRERPETAAALAALVTDFARHFPAIALRPMELSRDGVPLADVTAPDEVEAAFRALYAEVRATKLAERQVHLLIAGGRRTLSVFGMAVAQMLFDDQDRLWHLSSHPALEESGRLHAAPGEWARLIPIPVVAWGQLSPVFDALRDEDDPQQAAERLRQLRLRDQWDQARIFVLTKLSAAERRVVEPLVRDGLSNDELGARLCLSERTVEQHLRAAFAAAADHWELPSMNRTQLVALLRLYYLTRLPGEKIAGNPA
jgi:CRISPR-associated Csx14 family protein